MYVKVCVLWSVYVKVYTLWSVYVKVYVPWSVYVKVYVLWSVYVKVYVLWSVYVATIYNSSKRYIYSAPYYYTNRKEKKIQPFDPGEREAAAERR